MTSTAQHTADAAAASADCAGWAVPGLGQVHAGLKDGSEGGSEGGSGGADSHPIVVAMATCLEALESIRGVSASTLSAKEIRLMLLAVMQVVAAAFALKLRLLVAGEVQRVCDLTGARSTAAFLAHLTQTSHAHASGEVRLAKDLDERFPLLGEALESGLLGPDHIRVAVNALRKLPRDLDADQWEACQRFLIEAGQSVTPQRLRAVGRRLWEIVDPDAADKKLAEDLEKEEKLARARAFFQSWKNGDGTTGFRGRLPDLQAATLLKVLQAFASPRRRSNPNIDTLQPDDVHHDHPAGRGHLKGDTATGRTEANASGENRADRDSPGDSDDAQGSEDSDDVSPEERETGRRVPYTVRLGHALMELLERLPAEILPANAGVSALVRVTIDHDKLRKNVGAATVGRDLDVSPGQTRRLACNAGILPVVLGGRSQPLDVGRTRRLHTPGQREAMDIRDQECTADGCTVPAEWTEVHHQTAWDDGGETTVEAGFLVCPYHHHLIHSSRWTHRRVDGVLYFRRLRT